jgi:hypothetical protein
MRHVIRPRAVRYSRQPAINDSSRRRTGTMGAYYIINLHHGKWIEVDYAGFAYYDPTKWRFCDRCRLTNQQSRGVGWRYRFDHSQPSGSPVDIVESTGPPSIGKGGGGALDFGTIGGLLLIGLESRRRWMFGRRMSGPRPDSRRSSLNQLPFPPSARRRCRSAGWYPPPDAPPKMWRATRPSR